MVVAVWHGEGFTASLSRAVGIVLERPLEVFMHFLVLGLLVFPAVAFISTAVFAGSLVVGGFFASGVIGSIGEIGVGVRAMEDFGLGGAALSIGLVWFLASAVVGLIYVLGAIFVYRAVSEGVGSEATELVGQKLAQFKQKLDEYKPRAVSPAAPPAAPSADAAPSAAPAADGANAPAAPSPQASAAFCPNCGAAVQPTDLFCGSCGHKLK
jgi:hypothetical protein